ncbi:hypothetical protein K2Z84_05470 [Candidatus Binatia bacterium]|nr:hypothetical protein [Candidatus Binatia bacterium]
MRNRIGTGWGVVLGVTALAASGLLDARRAGAQSNSAFGVQQRADAAQQMILLGVSQGISNLPPTSGQSFVYEYDEALDTYKATGLLGPTAYRSPLTIGKGKMSVRVAGSYFQLNNTQNPLTYEITGGRAAGLPDPLFTRFGLKTTAKVGLFNFAYSYGPLEWLELSVNVPVSLVSAKAVSSFLTPTAAADAPIGNAPVAASTSEEDLDILLDRDRIFYREGTVNQLGADFNDVTSWGLGRVSLGGKAQFLHSDYVDAAFSMEIFLPSPSEDQYAGTNSAAFLPRLITAINLFEGAKAHIDAGYDFDTDFAELRRFVWNTGVSYAIPGVTFDTGVGGSKFNRGIEWTPSSFVQPPGSEVNVPLGFTALGDNTLGTNYVDFLFGVKGQILDDMVISGAVNVPINDQGIRPEAVGTVAVEMYF